MCLNWSKRGKVQICASEKTQAKKSWLSKDFNFFVLRKRILKFIHFKTNVVHDLQLTQFDGHLADAC